MYSSQVKRLLKELPNRGPCKSFTHSGRAENPICGDVVEFQFEITQGLVRNCGFRVYGCPGAVAAAAGVTVLLKGKALEFCERLSAGDLLQFLGGLPKQKQHGVDLAITALREALMDETGELGHL